MESLVERVCVPNFDEIQAGRELDALIAEKVFGWRWLVSEGSGKRGIFSEQNNPGWFSREASGHERLAYEWDCKLPYYSFDIASAWKLVERMQAEGHCLEVRPYVKVSSGYRVSIWEGGELDYATGETAPLAICRAALKALYLYSTAATTTA